MELMIALLIGLLVFFLLWALIGIFQETASEAYEIQEKEEEVESPILKLLLPLARIFANLLRPLFRGEKGPTILFQQDQSFRLSDYFFRFTSQWRRFIQKRLIGAGLQDKLDPLEIVGLQFVGLLLGLAFGGYVYFMLGSTTFLSIGALLGFFLPLLSISEKAAARKQEIQIALPYVLDLLTLSVEAGMDFTQALQRIIATSPRNALTEELARMLQQIQIGKPRQEALREFAERTDLEDARSIVQALIQADELGSPLGPILRIQAEQLRTKRAQRAEKLAQEAPVKMLAPLIGCIFPTVFIILFGPIIIKIVQQFYGG